MTSPLSLHNTAGNVPFGSHTPLCTSTIQQICYTSSANTKQHQTLFINCFPVLPNHKSAFSMQLGHVRMQEMSTAAALCNSLQILPKVKNFASHNSQKGWWCFSQELEPCGQTHVVALPLSSLVFHILSSTTEIQRHFQ